MTLRLRRAIGISMAATVLAILLGAVLADETNSRFSTAPAAALVGDAEVLRLGIGPTALSAKPEEIPRATVLVLDAPHPFGENEIDAYREFMARGGNVVVADTVGHGTQLSGRFGLNFERVRLHEGSKSVAIDLDEVSLDLTAGNASALRVPDPAHVVSWSSDQSFLDRSGDGAISIEDPRGPFPVVARVGVGAGTMWATSLRDAVDPFRESSSDERTFRGLILAPSGQTVVLVDESRLRSDDPILAVARDLSSISSTPWRWAIAGIAAMIFFPFVARGADRGLQAHQFDASFFIPRGGSAETTAVAHEGSGWTQRGLVAIAAATACILLGTAFGAPQAAWAGLVLSSVVFAAAVLRTPQGAGARRLAQPRIDEGAPLQIDTETVVPRAHAKCLAQDLASPLFEVAPAASTMLKRGRNQLSYTLKAARFGKYDVGPLRVERRDPLDLAVRVATVVPASQVTIVPRIEDARGSPFNTKIPQIVSASHQVNRAGGGAEFLALREYQQGDTMRMVNWKASARAKNMMVNQRVHETPMNLVLLIDARAESDWGPADRTPYVRSVRAAGSIALQALQGRDPWRMFMYGTGVKDIAGKGQDGLLQFQDYVARTPPGGETTLYEAAKEIDRHLKSNATIVVVTSGVGDPLLLEGLEHLRRHAARVSLVVPVIEGEAVDMPEVIREQSALIASARSRGFATFELKPAQLLEEVWRLAEMTP